MIWDLPVVALRNMVILPGVTQNIDVGRPKSKHAIDDAQSLDRRIILLTQKEAETDDPKLSDLYEMGVLGVIKQVVRMPDNTYQVLVEAQERARVISETGFEYLRVKVESYLNLKEDNGEVGILFGSVKVAFEEYERHNKNMRLDSYQLETIKGLTNAGELADQITYHSTWSIEEKQGILALVDIERRLEAVLKLLVRDSDRFDIDKKVAGRVKDQMDANQREYYLREQMKAIGKELGSGEDGPAEIEALREKIAEAGMPEAVQEKAVKSLDRLERTPAGSPESTVLRNYIDWLVDLPWSARDEEIISVSRTSEILNDDHYGLDDVKDRILEFLAVRQLTSTLTKKEDLDPEMRAPILCLAGPPGVGKTSLGKSIARSLNRKFVRMALGGLHDEAEIRGHRRTYIGSMPGRIIQAMKTAKVINPVILLDEIDKMSSDWRGDPSSAMLEVLDPEQNNTFQDHYLEVPYDLSQVMFITTANSLQTIPRPLLDRMEVINIPGYTQQEKVEIAKRYRIPRQITAHGLDGCLEISEPAISRIVEEYTAESGVRNLDRQISRLARKSARQMLEIPWDGVRTIEAVNVPELLGVPMRRPDKMEKDPQVGVAQGLAWTSVGGAMLLVEALATAGSGKISMTGSLGDVMKESVAAAVAYLRANATSYGADPDFYKNLDLHVHFPDGATPKDGPSAGITIATAVISAITGRPVRMDVAMTGEISLRGRVLPIGGVKEKLLAAHQGGIREVIIPRDNEPHLEEVPEVIRRDLKIHALERVGQVLDILLLPAPALKPPSIPHVQGQNPTHPGA